MPPLPVEPPAAPAALTGNPEELTEQASGAQSTAKRESKPGENCMGFAYYLRPLRNGLVHPPAPWAAQEHADTEVFWPPKF
jgi:hypothetical protein